MAVGGTPHPAHSYSHALQQAMTKGTTVTPKKPDNIKSQQALRCTWCGCVWASSPYTPDDDPAEHRLTCVDGWTPEYGIWTITYWKGYVEPLREPNEGDPGPMLLPFG